MTTLLLTSSVVIPAVLGPSVKVGVTSLMSRMSRVTVSMPAGSIVSTGGGESQEPVAAIRRTYLQTYLYVLL